MSIDILKPKETELRKWVNIYLDRETGIEFVGLFRFETESEAKDKAVYDSTNRTYVKTIQIAMPEL